MGMMIHLPPLRRILLGLAVRTLSSDERRLANVSRGLLVVNSSGPSERAGILPGDLLLSLNSKLIEDAAQLRA
jgi:serine protease Do